MNRFSISAFLWLDLDNKKPNWAVVVLQVNTLTDQLLLSANKKKSSERIVVKTISIASA